VQYFNTIQLGEKHTINFSNKKLNSLGEYLYKYSNESPVTFVFGDILFTSNTLENYLNYVGKNLQFDAIVGVSKSKVGDWNVQINNGLVSRIGKNIKGDYYTSGVFSIINQKTLKAVPVSDKVTDIFANIVTQGYKGGYFEITNAIDIDTPEDLLRLSYYLESTHNAQSPQH